MPNKATASSARLQDSLLDSALRLFALLIQKREFGIAAAGAAVEQHIRAVLAQESAGRLVTHFHHLCAHEQSPEEIIPLVIEAASYDERLYILLKILEFWRDAGDKAEIRDSFERLGASLGIQPVDVQAVLSVGAGRIPEQLSLMGSRVQVLPIRQSPAPASLCLPIEGLEAMIVLIGKTFYFLRRSEHSARIGRRNVPMNALFRIDEPGAVNLAGRVITVQDLQFYFRQGAHPRANRTLWLRVRDDTTTVFRSEVSPFDIRLHFHGATPVWESISPEPPTFIGGIRISGPTPVLLDDQIRYGRHNFDVRQIVRQHLPESFTFGDHDPVCTVSNSFRSDIHIADIAEEDWSCQFSVEHYALRIASTTGGPRILSDGRPVKENARLNPENELSIEGAPLAIGFDEHHQIKVEARPLGFYAVRVEGVSHQFSDGTKALDNLDLEFQHGDMVCVLGPSGCGKSTLLGILNGSITPTRGKVLIDGRPLNNTPNLITQIAFVPQDDVLHENLTVDANLRFAAKLRWPHDDEARISRRIAAVLKEIDLVEQRNLRVGDVLEKFLSGGQRKRVNIGLELLGHSHLMLLDEPTSGLSSGDARSVVSVLRRRADAGKIVLVVAHQPSARVLDFFDKVILLDKGGRLAFYGSVEDSYRYFAEVLPDARSSETRMPENERDPDILFEALQQSSLRIDGSPTGRLLYPPAYWQMRYRRKEKRYRPTTVRSGQPTSDRARTERTPRSVIRTCNILLHRELLNKIQGRVGLLLQLGSAVLLGLATALTCRVGGTKKPYAYSDNQALLNYIFLTVIVCLFLSMSASVQEIIRDRAILLRDRMLQIPFGAYLQSKFIPLFMIYACQLTLYLALGFWILKIPELFIAWWIFLLVVGCVGIAMGLAISSVPHLSERAASVFVPLAIIPQIILSGAEPFPFSSMKHLRLWSGVDETPEIAQIMPSRWAYEGLVTLHRDFSSAGEYMRAKKELEEDGVFIRHMPDAAAEAIQSMLASAGKRVISSADLGRRLDKSQQADLIKFAQRYRKIYGRPLLPNRLDLYLLTKSREVSPGKNLCSNEFYKAADAPHFPPFHTIPFTKTPSEVAVFDGVVLLIFAGIFITIASLLHRASSNVGKTMRLLELKWKMAVTKTGRKGQSAAPEMPPH